MTILTRIYREPAALIAFATAVLAVLTGLSVLTEVGATIALGVVAAAVGLLRYFVTPASEVVVQEKPNGTVVTHRTGFAAVAAEVAAARQRTDRGAIDLVTVALIIFIVAGVLVLVLR